MCLSLHLHQIIVIYAQKKNISPFRPSTTFLLNGSDDDDDHVYMECARRRKEMFKKEREETFSCIEIWEKLKIT